MGSRPACRLPAVGLAFAGLLLVGAGCRSTAPPESPDAAVPPPALAQSCGPNATTLGFRNPATQGCEGSPPPGREPAFAAFDQLYTSAGASPGAVTTGVIRFNTNLPVPRALAVLSAVEARDRATLSLRFPAFRGGTSLPLELAPFERTSVTAVQAALEQTVSPRGYAPAELAELRRAAADDAVVAGLVVRATVQALQEFWHENPELVRTITFDLPPSN